MADTVKKVRIEADVSSMQGEMERISSSGNELYSRLKQEALSYSESLDKQSIYIEKNIALEKRRLEQQIQYSRNALTLRKDEAIEAALPHQRKTIEREFEEKRKFIDKDYLSVKQEILDAQRRGSLDYDSQQRTKPTVEESNMDMSRMMAAGSGTARTAMNYGKIMAGAMGLGIAFGIGGMLSSMVEGAVKLDKSSRELNAVMGDLDTSMLSSASSIGKTRAEMNELTKEVAAASGGVIGGRTGNTAALIAQLAKGYNIDEGQLIGTMPTARISKSDISMEMVILLREMLRVGAVGGEKGFALMAEKFDFWARYNDMQSKQMLIVSPGRSTAMIGALQETGLPILSDQRQGQFVESMNNAIRKPQNEFMNAWVIKSLDQGKGLWETLVRQEQGIWGENNLTDLLRNAKRDFGGGAKEGLLFHMEQFFGGNKQLTGKFVNEVMLKPEALEKIQNSINRMTAIEKELAAEPDKKKRETLIKEWEARGFDIPKEFGEKVPLQKAQEATGGPERLRKELENIVSSAGIPILKEMVKVMGDPATKEAMKDAVGMLSFMAAEMIKFAAPIIKEAAILFSEVAKSLIYVFGGGQAIDYVNARRDLQEKLDGTKLSVEEKSEVKKLLRSNEEKWGKTGKLDINDRDDIINELFFENRKFMHKYDYAEEMKKAKEDLKKTEKEIEKEKKEGIKAIAPEHDVIKDAKEKLEENRNLRKKIKDQNTGMIGDYENNLDSKILFDLNNSVSSLNNTMTGHSEIVKKANEIKDARWAWKEGAAIA